MFDLHNVITVSKPYNIQCFICKKLHGFKVLVTCSEHIASGLEENVATDNKGLYCIDGIVHGYALCSQCLVYGVPELEKIDGKVVYNYEVFSFCEEHQSP